MDNRQEKPYNVDEAILADPFNEERDSINYYINANAYLLNVLHSEKKLRESPLYEQVLQFIRFFNAEPSKRDNTSARKAMREAHFFGIVGKALWYLWKKNDPQLKKELHRLARNPGALIGNYFLFYISGTLAAKEFSVTFVPEQGKHGEKTPDLIVEKRGRRTWIEVNAKQPNRVIDTPERLWQLIRDIIEEKSQKFADPKYSPGMIVADISTAYNLVNENGKVPSLKLLRELCRPLGENLNQGFVYRLYEDPEWNSRRENQGNVFAYLVEEFSRIDRSKYHVYQCLFTITREVWHSERKITFPKGHQLIVHRDAEAQALTELSQDVYIVDSRPPR